MLYRGKENRVFDLVIGSYYETIDHEWLIRILEHRIGNGRVITPDTEMAEGGNTGRG